MQLEELARHLGNWNDVVLQDHRLITGTIGRDGDSFYVATADGTLVGIDPDSVESVSPSEKRPVGQDSADNPWDTDRSRNGSLTVHEPASTDFLEGWRRR